MATWTQAHACDQRVGRDPSRLGSDGSCGAPLRHDDDSTQDSNTVDVLHVDMWRCSAKVQHPVRGLFLRYFLLQVVKEPPFTIQSGNTVMN